METEIARVAESYFQNLFTLANSLSFSKNILHKIKYTHIVLIPKKNEPKSIFDFCPIRLGNVVSRIVSKVLANQLKIILPNVISDSKVLLFPNG